MELSTSFKALSYVGIELGPIFLTVDSQHIYITLVNSSVTIWLDYFFHIWPFNIETLPNSIMNLPKNVQNFAIYLMDPSKFAKVV